jgi:hypothetical protein
MLLESIFDMLPRSISDMLLGNIQSKYLLSKYSYGNTHEEIPWKTYCKQVDRKKGLHNLTGKKFSYDPKTPSSQEASASRPFEVDGSWRREKPNIY